MRIQKRILAIFGVALIATTYFFYFIYKNHKKIAEDSSKAIQNQEIINKIDSAFYSIANLESNTKSFIITGSGAFEQEARNDVSTLKTIADEFKSLPKTNNEDNAIISGIIEKIIQKVNFELEIIETNKVSQKNALEIMAGMNDRFITDSLKQFLARLQDSYSRQVNSHINERRLISNSNLKFSIIIGVFALILIGIILTQVNRFMRLKRTAENDARLKEIKYSRFVENSGMVLLTTDLEGNISFVNNRVGFLTGYEPSEIIGKHFSFLVGQQWVPAINNNFKKQLQTKGYELLIEFPLNVKSGGQIWVEQSSIILFDNGTPTGFQCIVKDITERKKMDIEKKKIELEREESQYRLQSILDNTTLIIYIKDLEGRYLLINKTYKEIFHFTEEQAIGKTDFDLLPEDEAQRNYDIDQYVIREQKTIEMEETISQPDGNRNLLLVRFPLFDKNHKIYGIGGIATDNTERFLYGQHLIEAKTKAEMAEQLQEQFLANMSHEIRTPMNGIIGMTNILIDSPLTEEQKEFVQVIKRSSDNLLILINDILDISKIKAGKLRIENIDFRLREVIETTMAPFNVKIMEKGLKLGVVVDRNIPDSLAGDPHRLNQILTNLLSNAIKFTENGEINLGIKMLSNQEDNIALEFSISDTGIGISADKLHYIFESFTQAETGITRKFGGTGLGLSITKKLIELQGGKIDVTSMPNKGTTFTFIINYDVANKDVPQKQEAGVEEENIPGESLAGKKILVIEDNETNRKVIYHMLKKVGIATNMACNGKEAVKLLEEGHQCDLIIMDLQMPEMDGFDTTIYIRNQLKLTIPIIAMTASAMRNEKAKCLELGMNEYLTKPFVPAELYRQLKRYLLSNHADAIVHTEETKPAEDTKEQEKLYSLDHLIELDDVDCLYEVLQLFLDSTPIALSDISAAIKETNWDQVYKQSHKLKSSLGLLQMNKLLSFVTRMESDAKDKINLDRISKDFKVAEKLFKEVKPMIEAELKEASILLIKN